MMMHTPKTIGRPTSTAAARNSDCRSLSRDRAGSLQASHEVLHHDDRGVDEQAEVERAETHEIGGHADLPHRQNGEQQRQRDDGRGDQRRSDVPQEQEQDQRDEQAAFQRGCVKTVRVV